MWWCRIGAEGRPIWTLLLLCCLLAGWPWPWYLMAGLLISKMGTSVPASVMLGTPSTGSFLHPSSHPCRLRVKGHPLWLSLRKLLTELDKQDSGGRNHFLAICRHTLEVACVCGIKVSNPQSRAIVGCPKGDPPGLLDHRGIIFEPADGGRWIPRDFAVQFSRLPQGRGDVIHWLIEGQVRICACREKQADERGRPPPRDPDSLCASQTRERLNRSGTVETEEAWS